MARSEQPKCPTCGRPTVPIVYGMPGPGLFEEAERGAVVLGGCVIEFDMPTLVCNGRRHHHWRRDDSGEFVAVPG